MKRFNCFTVFLVILALVSISACATVSIQPKPWDQMSAKEKSLFFIQTYNQQYKDTMAMAQRTDLTDAQKQIVAKKKEILTKAWPLIKLYDSTVTSGGVPSPRDEQQIYNLITDLSKLL